MKNENTVVGFIFYMPARDIAIGKMDAMSFSSMSLKAKFMEERFNLTLNVSDPFNLSGFSLGNFVFDCSNV
jgi:hypothetical protein